MSPHLLSGATRLAGSSLLRMQSDDRLIALVRDGHDPAFSAIVERYRAELLRYTTRLVGESRAEDIVQQALLSAHTAMTSADDDIRLRPWLYRIAHNAAVNVLRSSRQEAELDDRLAASGPGLADDLQTRERLHEALVAISRLPEPQRDALTLRALDGRSHQEIADVLGVSPGAARQHVHRARATVRAAVSAITPYGLIVRFAMGDVGEPAAVVTGAGLGVGATAAKIGAGVLAAGALATGAAHLPLTAHPHRPARAAHSAREAAAAQPIAAPAPAAGAVDIVSATTAAPAHRGSAADRRGRSGSTAAEHHGGRDSSDGRSPGSGTSHGDDSHSGSSGSDDSHSGSGSGSGSGTSGADDHSGTSGSSGSDGGGSGTSGGGSTGTTTTSSGSGSDGGGVSGSDGGSGETITTSGMPSGSDGKSSSGSGSSDGGIDGGSVPSTDG